MSTEIEVATNGRKSRARYSAIGTLERKILIIEKASILYRETCILYPYSDYNSRNSNTNLNESTNKLENRVVE